MPIAAGTRLDAYEILGLLGAGGMGEVYRARDSVLKREVAIKVLPSFVSRDSDRLSRFEQEAQAAAALNHPNILAVHQFGQFDGSPYLVSELLEGSTLRQLLQRGPLPVRKAIDYGVQIAHGLAAAHEKGIVHRDLKPENLFITKDEHVKILDFGLAKLMHRERDPEATAATATHETDPGMVMGTAGYMSPEQVRGETVDHRTDIFSFGAILYEMLSGKRAFQRSTSAETMTAILNEEPPALSQTGNDIAPGLLKIVHRCLEKNPEQRFHSASDLAFALDALSDSGSASTASVQRSSRSRWVWPGLLGAVVLAVLLIAWWRTPAAVPVVESMTQLTDDGERKDWIVVSDGTRIYFSETVGINHFKILQASATGGPTTPIDTKLPSASIAALAGNGAGLLAYGKGDSQTGYELWMIPLPTGEPRRIGNFLAVSADIFPDGRIVYTQTRNRLQPETDLSIVGKDGFNPRKLITVPTYIEEVRASPDGQRVIFRRYDNNSLNQIAVDGTGLKELLKPGKTDCCFDWSADRKYLLYSSIRGDTRDIWAFPLEGGVFRPSRQPIRLTTGPISFWGYPFPSPDGRQIFVLGVKDRAELVYYDMKLHKFLPFLSGISATEPTFSSDGQWVVYRSLDSSVWRSRSDGSNRLQLTSPEMGAIWPYISPDGTKVAFSNDGIFLMDINGGKPEKIIEKGNSSLWSPDSNLLVFDRHDGMQVYDLRTKKTAVPGGQKMNGGAWASQDMIVGATDLADGRRAYQTFDFKTQKWTPLFTDHVPNCFLSPDRKYLYFTTGGAEASLKRIRFSDGQIETVTSLKDFRQFGNYYTQLNVAPDGSPVLTRDASSNEIYALSVRWP